MGGGVTWQQPEASLLHVHMALYTYLRAALAALPGSSQRRGRFAHIGVQQVYNPYHLTLFKLATLKLSHVACIMKRNCCASRGG